MNKQSPVNSLKPCPSSLFLLPKTIESAVGAEKRQKIEESQKMEEKIDKKKSAEETKESAGKSIIIRLYPNKSQKEDLNKWFGTARWTYNQVVASICTSPRDISKYAVVKEL
jgi:hypothetical protein